MHQTIPIDVLRAVRRRADELLGGFDDKALQGIALINSDLSGLPEAEIDAELHDRLWHGNQGHFLGCGQRTLAHQEILESTLEDRRQRIINFYSSED